MPPPPPRPLHEEGLGLPLHRLFSSCDSWARGELRRMPRRPPHHLGVWRVSSPRRCLAQMATNSPTGRISPGLG